MAFTAQDVKNLREKTGVGMMECKKALVEADGDMEKAIEILRERGLASSAKKSSRVAAEGLVVTAVDKANKISAIVEINCETDFVAGNPEFKDFCNAVAKTVLESKPADLEALLASPISGGTMTVEETKQELFLKVRENMNVRRFAVVEGIVADYIHMGGSVGVIVSFAADDDTAAKAEFAEMGKNVAMQIAAMKPEYLSEADISADELEKMRTITIESALNKPESLPKPILMNVFAKALPEFSEADAAAYEEQKSNKFLFNFLSKEAIAKLAEVAVASKDEIAANPIFGKVVDGRIAKQIKESCLLKQDFVRSDIFEGTVGAYIASVAKTLGASIECTGYTIYVRGEGIEKKESNFAEEIASMIK